MPEVKKYTVTIRLTYWNVPCTRSTLSAGLASVEKALAAHGPGTPPAARSSFLPPSRCEHKVGTYAGRQVVLTVEVWPASAPPAFPHPMVLHCQERSFRPDRGRSTHTYRLFGYAPFRSQAYTSYRHARTLTEQRDLLQAHLQYHLTKLAAELAFPTQVTLQLSDVHLVRERKVRLGGTPQAGFDLMFTTNLFIPEFIGLGRGARLGLGVVRPVRGVRA